MGTRSPPISEGAPRGVLFRGAHCSAVVSSLPPAGDRQDVIHQTSLPLPLLTSRGSEGLWCLLHAQDLRNKTVQQHPELGPELFRPDPLLPLAFFLSGTLGSLRKQKRRRSRVAAGPPLLASSGPLPSGPLPSGGPSCPAQFSLGALSKQSLLSQITLRVYPA